MTMGPTEQEKKMKGMLTMTVMPPVGGEDEMYLLYDNEANRVGGKDEM